LPIRRKAAFHLSHADATATFGEVRSLGGTGMNLVGVTAQIVNAAIAETTKLNKQDAPNDLTSSLGIIHRLRCFTYRQTA